MAAPGGHSAPVAATPTGDVSPPSTLQRIDEAIVPVTVTMRNGAAKAPLTQASVTVFSDTTPRRVLGVSRTGSKGAALVVLSTKTAPRSLVVRISGGYLGRVPSSRTVWRTFDHYLAPHAVAVVAATSQSTGLRRQPPVRTAASWNQAASSDRSFLDAVGIHAAPTARSGFTDWGGLIVGVASLAYSVFSGSSSTIETDLSNIESQLTQAQAELGTLQQSVNGLTSDTDYQMVSGLMGDATKTVTEIGTATSDAIALVQMANQVVCDPPTGTSTTSACYYAKYLSAGGGFGAVMSRFCKDKHVPSGTCAPFQNAQNNLSKNLTSSNANALNAAHNLAGWALGNSAAKVVGTPADATDDGGAVQWAMAGQSTGQKFITSADLSVARQTWAWFAGEAIMAQVTFALIESMGIGQPLTDGSGATLTSADVQTNVGQLDYAIELFLATYPSFPDNAVMDTQYGNTIAPGDAPNLWATQVGALATWDAYDPTPSTTTWTLSGSGSSVSITGAPSGGLAPNPGSGPAPALTTINPTWELLPTPPARATLPTTSATPLSGWSQGSVNWDGTQPAWNNKDAWTNTSGGFTAGPLVDLYAGLTVPSGQLPGQVMNGASGINSALFTVTGVNPWGSGTCTQSTGSATNPSGWTCPPGPGVTAVSWVGTQATPPMVLISCQPGVLIEGTSSACLLPTWATTSINPWNVTTSSNANTGFFDYANGQSVYNQAVGFFSSSWNRAEGYQSGTTVTPYGQTNSQPLMGGNGSNGPPNVTIPGIPGLLNGGVDCSNGCVEGSSQPFSANGRPVLFTMEQNKNQCFYWDPALAASNGGAWGSGCTQPPTDLPPPPPPG